MTGFGVSGSTLGVPDVGLMSATEMVDRARALNSACYPVPLIADGDNGHGDVLNVARITGLYERACVECIQLEDQVFPKRCGHMEKKEIVDREQATDKIKAAVDPRKSDDFLIMARTDARSIVGMDEALLRDEMFLAAGADLLFIEAPESETELRTIANEFDDHHLVANMVEDGKTPCLSFDALAEIGFSVVLFPVSSLLVVANTLRHTYASMIQQGTLPAKIKRVGSVRLKSVLTVMRKFCNLLG